jgi:hypothetical protein
MEVDDEDERKALYVPVSAPSVATGCEFSRANSPRVLLLPPREAEGTGRGGTSSSEKSHPHEGVAEKRATEASH